MWVYRKRREDLEGLAFIPTRSVPLAVVKVGKALL